MTRLTRLLHTTAWLLAGIGSAQAETMRDFPATIVIEEPQAETEVAPNIAMYPVDGIRHTDLDAEISIQLTERLDVQIGPAYTFLRPGGQGFQAQAFAVKYQFVADATHELVVSAGVAGIVGGTGSRTVDADLGSSLEPTFFFGKGGGDLPDALAWARPLAVTGQFGLVLPVGTSLPSEPAADGEGERLQSAPAHVIDLRGSLQYSLPYLANMGSTTLPPWLAGFIPLVEVQLAVPFGTGATRMPVVGTANPGFLYLVKNTAVTLGCEMLVPLTRASGDHPGFRLQLSYSFDSPFIPRQADAD